MGRGRVVASNKSAAERAAVAASSAVDSPPAETPPVEPPPVVSPPVESATELLPRPPRAVRVSRQPSFLEEEIEAEARALAQKMLSDIEWNTYQSGNEGVQLHMDDETFVDGDVVKVAIRFNVVVLRNRRWKPRPNR